MTVENKAGVGFANKPAKGELEITKRDVADGSLLPNAGFRIKDADGNIVVEGRTDENGIAKFTLRVGKYTYEEFDAPEGYLMLLLMRQPSYGRNIEFTDNRISLFSAQWGKCAVTGRAFQCLEEIHCHHKTPKCQGGGDEYANLILVWEPVHKLIHASNSEAIQKYLSILNLDRKQMATLNVLRKLASMPEIV